MSWVVGRGRESWVWVVGVGKCRGQKNVFQKRKKLKIKKQIVLKFMKRKSPSTYQSYSPSPRSAKQIFESSSTN